MKSTYGSTRPTHTRLVVITIFTRGVRPSPFFKIKRNKTDMHCQLCVGLPIGSLTSAPVVYKFGFWLLNWNFRAIGCLIELDELEEAEDYIENFRKKFPEHRNASSFNSLQEEFKEKKAKKNKKKKGNDKQDRWRQVSPMIPSARPTVPPVVITIFTWKLFFCTMLKRRNGRMSCVKTVISTGRDCGLAEWINKCYKLPSLIGHSSDITIIWVIWRIIHVGYGKVLYFTMIVKSWEYYYISTGCISTHCNEKLSVRRCSTKKIDHNS